MKDYQWKLCHLHRSRGSTRRMIQKILLHDPQLDSLYSMTPNQLSQQYSIPYSRATILHEDLHSRAVQKSLESDIKRYHVLTFDDLKYPPLLKFIPDPPLVLYAYGNLQLLYHLPSLSVVGTRQYSKEAEKKLDIIISPLIKKDWVIVSGMAKGIDSLAHEKAMLYGGKTIAVLGFGFNHIYPEENKELMIQLAKEQLLLTEYPPHIPPKRWHFPERNRIISGLSFGTVVVEAQERSGSLITADQALEQGREVFAIPGSIFTKQSEGCHKIVQEGAKLVRNTYDITTEWEHLEEKWRRILSENSGYS